MSEFSETPQPTVTTPQALYPFDLNLVEIDFNIKPGASTPQIVSHRLRKPTLAELIARDQAAKSELIEVSKKEDEIVSEEFGANARLWDMIAEEVRGYRGMDDWTKVTDEMKARMRTGHKSAAIVRMYAADFRVEANEEEALSIGGDSWTIKQLIGTNPENPAFTVRHTLREPTESEFRKYKGKASTTSTVRGSKKAHIKIVRVLKTCVELYDALVTDIEGATVSGELFSLTNRQHFLSQIDPIWKRSAIVTLFDALEAELQD